MSLPFQPYAASEERLTDIVFRYINDENTHVHCLFSLNGKNISFYRYMYEAEFVFIIKVHYFFLLF